MFEIVFLSLLLLLVGGSWFAANYSTWGTFTKFGAKRKCIKIIGKKFEKASDRELNYSTGEWKEGAARTIEIIRYDEDVDKVIYKETPGLLSGHTFYHQSPTTTLFILKRDKYKEVK
jgi:hypothetical protein